MHCGSWQQEHYKCKFRGFTIRVGSEEKHLDPSPIFVFNMMFKSVHFDGIKNLVLSDE